MGTWSGRGADSGEGPGFLHKHLGGTVDVEVGEHSCRTRLTAVNASEAVMSGRAR